MALAREDIMEKFTTLNALVAPLDRGQSTGRAAPQPRAA
jgi:hypothetical protein